VKSLAGLFEMLLLDLGGQCGAVRVAKDIETLRRRVEHEGVSFLTITLPTFSQALESALEEGTAAPWAGKGFALQRSGIPHFLSGFLRHVFDSAGRLLANPSVDCISAVRQICRFAKSVRLPCTSARNAAAIEGYVECESEVVDSVNEMEGSFVETFRRVAREFAWSLQLDQAEEAYRPTHGPGVVREKLTANERWDRLPYWPTRLADVGLSARMALFGHENPLFGVEFEDESAWFPALVSPGDEAPVKVVLVPKTLSKPRVIAVEPAAQQFAQQGISRWLRDVLENAPLTRGHVNFRDQDVNKALALCSSGDGKFATLDMKDASDRVGLLHVELAFEAAPDTLRTLMAARSQSAELPDGRVIRLRKYASMGSALCFVVEAYIFYLSIIASRISHRGLPVSRRTIAAMAKDVYVYGDDLVVPADEAPAIMESLEAFGFRVNPRKCFWKGRFRESCGMDAYGGVEVTPTYLRAVPPSDRADVHGILSTVATANQLHQKGCWRTRDLLRQAVESLIGPLPGGVAEEDPAVGWVFETSAKPPLRYDSDFQRERKLCWVAIAPRRPDPLEGLGALAKCLRNRGGRGEPNLEATLGWKFILSSWEEHLRSSVRPYALKLKRRWL